MSGASSTGSFDDGCEGSTQLDTITELMSRTYSPAHEPSRLRVADPRSGPRLCEAQRFMVPMRAQKRKEAFHEPRLHRDNCLLQVQHRIVLASSWFRCAIVKCGVRNAELSQSLLMSAATVQGFNARNFSAKSLPGLKATLSPSDGKRDRVRGLRKSCRPDSTAFV